MAGIDFMAIARGRQLARDENWQDVKRAQEEQKFAIQREKWQDEVRELAFNREAQAYVAPLVGNMQAAASAGIGSAEYLIQQREQILADPNFQRFSPEVQNRVLTTLGQSVRGQLQDLQRMGQPQEAIRLAQAYGLVPPANALDVARFSGDPMAILDFFNSQYGANLNVNPDGTVTVAGQNVPLDQLAYVLAQTGQGAAGLNLVTQIRGQEAAAAQRQAELAALGYPPGVTPAPGAQPVDNTPAGIVSSAFASGVGPTPGQLPGVPAAPLAAPSLQVPNPLAGTPWGGAQPAVQPAAVNPAQPSGGLTSLVELLNTQAGGGFPGLAAPVTLPAPPVVLPPDTPMNVFPNRR